MRTLFIVILGHMFFLVGCQKKPADCNYVAGCADDIFSINDTISESKLENIIQSRPSITLEHVFSRYMTSMFSSERAMVFTYGNFEILTDTAPKLMIDNRDTIYEVKYSPLILNFGDLIDPDGFWSDTALWFTNYYDYLKHDPETGPARRIYPGWNNLGNKYMAFRETGHDETIYGWIEVEIIDYKIIIYRYGLQ